MFATEKGEQICAYCKTGKSLITFDFEDGTTKTLTKKDAIGKYKEFTNNVFKKPGLKKLLVKNQSSIIQ